MNFPDKIIYSAVFLTPESQEKLLAKFPACHPNIFAHHSTIAFRPQSFDLTLGKKYLLKVIGYVANDKAQAILVENIYSKMDYPHITISTAEGIAPVYSNELITSFPMTPVDDLSLEGVIGYFNGTTDITQ